MAEVEFDESNCDRGENVPIIQSESNFKGASNVDTMHKNPVSEEESMLQCDSVQNGSNIVQKDPAQPHVTGMNDNKTQTSNSTDGNIPENPVPATENAPKTGAIVSPEAPTKRRRVQHDYRLLSNAGYVDDYERSGKELFTLANEKDADFFGREAETVDQSSKSPKGDHKEEEFVEAPASSSDSDEYGKLVML